MNKVIFLIWHTLKYIGDHGSSIEVFPLLHENCHGILWKASRGVVSCCFLQCLELTFVRLLNNLLHKAREGNQSTLLFDPEMDSCLSPGHLYESERNWRSRNVNSARWFSFSRSYDTRSYVHYEYRYLYLLLLIISTQTRR